MAAAVEDIEHGHGETVGDGPAEVAVKGLLGRVGGGAGHREGDAQHGVRAQAGLVRRAVEFDEEAVDGALVGGGLADEGGVDLGVDVLDGLQDALAAVAAGIAITQLDGFVGAGGGARGDCRLSHGAIIEEHRDLHGGVAA